MMVDATDAIARAFQVVEHQIKVTELEPYLGVAQALCNHIVRAVEQLTQNGSK